MSESIDHIGDHIGAPIGDQTGDRTGDRTITRTIAAAVAGGILPARAAPPPVEARPWALLLLTALGAWLAAIPLVLAMALLLDDLLYRGFGAYLIGTLILSAAVVLLRSGARGPDPAATGRPPGVALFLEQLAVPALLVGCAALGFGLFRDLPTRTAAGGLTLAVLALAALLPRPWLRVLLGAAAAGLLTLTLLGGHAWDLFHWGNTAPWLALHGVLALWLAGLAAQRALAARGETAHLAGALEPLGTGWLVATLAGLAILSGMTLLVAASLKPWARDLAQGWAGGGRPLWIPAASSLLALAGVAWGAWRWPALRRPWVLGAGLVVIALAWFMPTLGGLWLALMVTVTTQRWRLAVAAALAAAWVLGAFYYQLQWPLGTKALVLAGGGAVLGVLAWSAVRGGGGAGGGERAGPVLGAPGWWLIALTGLASLTVANLGIWEKETLIRHGRPVFVALAPVDPRSLLQGDYMRLNFRVPPAAGLAVGPLSGARPRVVARPDARGIADLLRLARPDERLVEGEFLIELTARDGRWTLVSDAWYFREGEAKRWQGARYGEFRVAADGRALLVGLADGDLRALGP